MERAEKAGDRKAQMTVKAEDNTETLPFCANRDAGATVVTKKLQRHPAPGKAQGGGDRV